jgi:exosome complex component MTR3
MPDPKRNHGPDGAIEPPILQKETPVPLKSVDKSNLRPDGRKWNELRSLFLKVGIITKAQGSVYIEMGNTKLIAAVYGPKEVLRREEFSLKGKVTCEFKYMPFSRAHYCEPRQNFEEKMISKCICDAMEGVILLERFPKAQVEISVQVIQDDGSALALALTAASVALINANIEVKDLVVGTTLRFFENSEILVDPTAEEEHGPFSKYSGGAGFHLAVLPSLSQISYLKQTGKVEQSHAKDCIETCWETCLRLATGIKKLLQDSIEESAPG